MLDYRLDTAMNLVWIQLLRLLDAGDLSDVEQRALYRYLRQHCEWQLAATLHAARVLERLIARLDPPLDPLYTSEALGLIYSLEAEHLRPGFAMMGDLSAAIHTMRQQHAIIEALIDKKRWLEQRLFLERSAATPEAVAPINDARPTRRGVIAPKLLVADVSG